jgi:hypothetical protein
LRERVPVCDVEKGIAIFEWQAEQFLKTFTARMHLFMTKTFCVAILRMTLVPAVTNLSAQLYGRPAGNRFFKTGWAQ